MTTPDEFSFGDDAPEADAVEQLIPVEVSDEDTDLDADRVTMSRDWDANEADLIEQAIAVPLSDEADFDR
ncbi:hypothetical protein [Mycobacterium hubeiense]|uniref:hypothetical protein n=1 Tax=Mycobacterium hubeiense TaxID=1867256 RepID=UPI000C7F6F16|nr:hypothetical protein [Mycobacterium sp. QGD 101]